MPLEIFGRDKKETPEFKTGLPPGVLACHRFFVPMPVHHDIPGKVNGTMECRNAAGMSFIPCLKDECTLWNRDKKVCSDRLANDAQAGK